MKPEYLTGVVQQPSSFSQIAIIGIGTDTWYASSYKTVKRDNTNKEKIVAETNQLLGKSTALSDWEWHHVVETQHISQIIDCYLKDEEEIFMPTILISKKEHSFLSQNFNNNAFRELSTIGRGRGSSAGQKREEIMARIANLRMMYDNAYLNYPTLRKIAHNVFDYQLNRV